MKLAKHLTLLCREFLEFLKKKIWMSLVTFYVEYGVILRDLCVDFAVMR